MAESTVVVRVDDALKAAFTDAAKASDRTTSQLLRDFMRDYVKSQADAAEYNTWFRHQVAAGMADARAGRVRSGNVAEAYFARKRAVTKRNAAGRKR